VHELVRRARIGRDNRAFFDEMDHRAEIVNRGPVLDAVRQIAEALERVARRLP
jgi:hypothetical protein